ncbi:unnamed protein product [Camellia sinensis]
MAYRDALLALRAAVGDRTLHWTSHPRNHSFGFVVANCISPISSAQILEWDETVSCSQVGDGNNGVVSEQATKPSIAVRVFFLLYKCGFEKLSRTKQTLFSLSHLSPFNTEREISIIFNNPPHVCLLFLFIYFWDHPMCPLLSIWLDLAGHYLSLGKRRGDEGQHLLKKKKKKKKKLFWTDPHIHTCTSGFLNFQPFPFFYFFFILQLTWHVSF